MTERREPTVSAMPIDSRDDAAPRARPKTGDAPSRTGSRPSPQPVSSRPVVIKSPVGGIALMIAGLALAGAGYLFWLTTQVQQQVMDRSTQLSAAEARITELEKRLMLSDDESTQSLTVLQANVKENAGEIRKLWGVSYDRNRKAIASIEESISKLEKSTTSADGAIKNALAELTGELRVVSELVDAQQSAISRADQNAKIQTETFTVLQQQLNTLDKDLRQKVLANEEAIQSIDAFRLQVNRDLLQLKGG